MQVYYSTRPAEWIEDFCITYNPRAKKGEMRIMPFVLFKRQREFVEYLWQCVKDGENGLVEKARDIGATWLACAFSIWLWLYHAGSAIGWGSRKEQLVDKLGDPSSIFEKMRMILRKLPRFMIPLGFSFKNHCTYMKIIHPTNGSVITGEAGDNIGRGGRSTMYFKDESAHYEHPELIQAALDDNTDVQIDISSVHGTNNVFYRRRMAGEVWAPGKEMKPNYTRIFIFDWRDHPGKTQEWYDARRAKSEREGLLHNFYQEVDRDYQSSVQGIIIPVKWIRAAIDAHKKLGITDEGDRIAALDVADQGNDSNALAIRKGVILRHCTAWAKADDVGDSTRRAVTEARIWGVDQFYYDSIGLGAGVRAETNNLIRDGVIHPRTMRVMPWNAAASPIDADDHLIASDDQSPLIGDILLNMKSQGWFYLRRRFEKTFRALYKGEKYDQDELISIDSTIEGLEEIINELAQPVWKKDPPKGKMQVDKLPDGASSPNKADAIMMAYLPTREVSILDVL